MVISQKHVAIKIRFLNGDLYENLFWRWKLKQTNNRAVVYTNQITALSNEYAWNNELKAPEIYIRNKDGIFTRIDNLTNKILREAHNIMRMYIAGAFRNEV